MKRIGLLGLWVIGFGLCACQGPISADYTYDREARFSEYTSYAWITLEPSLEMPSRDAVADPRFNPIVDAAIRRSIDRVLASRGYTKTKEMGSADLVLAFSLGSRERVHVDSYPASMGYGHARGAWYSTVDVEVYTEGILAIDFFDRETRRAVWHGWGSKRLPYRPNPDKLQENVDEAVDVILLEFPFRNTAR